MMKLNSVNTFVCITCSMQVLLAHGCISYSHSDKLWSSIGGFWLIQTRLFCDSLDQPSTIHLENVHRFKETWGKNRWEQFITLTYSGIKKNILGNVQKSKDTKFSEKLTYTHWYGYVHQMVFFAVKSISFSKYFAYISRFPANIYLFKVNDRNTRKRCKTFSKLITKTAEDIVLVFLLLTLNILLILNKPILAEFLYKNNTFFEVFGYGGAHLTTNHFVEVFLSQSYVNTSQNLKVAVMNTLSVWINCGS